MGFPRALLGTGTGALSGTGPGSPLGTGKMILGQRFPGLLGELLSLLSALDIAPFVGWRLVESRKVGQSKQVRPAITCIARPALLGVDGKSQGFHFTEGWSDGFAADAKNDELVIGDRQSAV